MATGEQLLRIANATSALMRECFGKGPARARAYEIDSFVFVVLEGAFIDAEETLVRHGRDGDVRSFRASFEEVLAPRMAETVAQCLGVAVLDSMSQVLTRSGVVVEIFHLAKPADPSGHPRA